MPQASLTQRVSANGDTRKDLLELADGARIETVLLRYRDRYTVCVSTQVGCACNCSFCATGQTGFVRHLTPDEITAQVQHFRHELAPLGKDVSNVVFMGMGEPLLNLEATMTAMQHLTDPRGLSLAPGRITVSTVGIPAGIRHLAEAHRKRPVKLAVSLHAATDDIRSSLMPINQTYPLAHLHEALRIYTTRTHRHALLEWVMIDGVNDTPAQAIALVDWLDGLPAHVNLIRLNPTPVFEGRASSEAATDAFSVVLDQHGIPHTMRQRRGSAIDAGCGQLYAGRRLLHHGA